MMSYSHKILVTGGKGQIASAIAKCQNHHGLQIINCDKHELDINSATSITLALEKYQPDIVINTAAYTAVDDAEVNPTEAFKLNYSGAKNLAEACAAAHIYLIHLGTDYVFDGKQNKAYTENDLTNPINIYGESKLAGEQAILSCHEHAIILRVSGVFSVYGKNFVKTIFRLAKEKDCLNVISDQFTCPTSANDIAEVLLIMANKIIESKYTKNIKPGIYHYCSKNSVSWHDFATNIINFGREMQQNFTIKLQAISADSYPSRAKRPTFSVLNCEKLFSIFGITQPAWEHSLRTIVKQLAEKNDVI